MGSNILNQGIAGTTNYGVTQNTNFNQNQTIYNYEKDFFDTTTLHKINGSNHGSNRGSHGSSNLLFNYL